MSPPAEAVKRYTIPTGEYPPLEMKVADKWGGFVAFEAADEFVLASDYDALTTELSHFKNGTADLIATIASLRSELAKQDAAIARAEEALKAINDMPPSDNVQASPDAVKFYKAQLTACETLMFLAASKGTGK